MGRDSRMKWFYVVIFWKYTFFCFAEKKSIFQTKTKFLTPILTEILGLKSFHVITQKILISSVSIEIEPYQSRNILRMKKFQEKRPFVRAMNNSTDT